MLSTPVPVARRLVTRTARKHDHIAAAKAPGGVMSNKSDKRAIATVQ